MGENQDWASAITGKGSASLSQALQSFGEMAEVRATCGTLIHFVLSDEELTARFASYMGPFSDGEDDSPLSVDNIAGFLTEVHNLASPHCTEPLGVARKEAGS